MTLKKMFVLTFMITTFITTAYSQDYFYGDDDVIYMKLTEVSTDTTYGFELKNPIKVGSNDFAVASYLNSLKTLDGDSWILNDYKINYKNMTGIKKYVLTYVQKKDTTTIYFLTTDFEQPKAINGFSFKTIDDIPKVYVFPSDSVVKVTTCSQTIYSVDYFLIKEKYGELVEPTTSPTFMGGIKELRKYFNDNRLTDQRAQIYFNVSIAFVVTCNGKAGNFVIVTKDKGLKETLANQILAIVNKMPQNWQPATVDGNPVDCYQFLDFSLAGDWLGRVLYRE